MAARSHLKAGMILTLTLAAGAAQGVWTPKTCPPDAMRKNEPQAARVSDFVAAQPRARIVERPALLERPATVDGAQRQVMVFRQGDGNETCEICIEDGQVRATRNGEPVEARLIERDGDVIRLRGQDGQERMVVRTTPHVTVMGQPLPGMPQGRVRVRQGTPLLMERVVEGQPLGARVVEGRPLRARVVEGRPLDAHVVEGQPLVLRRAQARGHGQAFGDGQTFTFEVAPQGHGQARVVRTPGMSRVMTPPVPPVPGRPGAQVQGQVIIMDQNGQTRTIELGEGGHGGQAIHVQPHGQIHSGQGGQVRTFTIPGGQGHGQAQVRIMTSGDHSAQQGEACCGDCAQDGSCCDCGGGQTGGHGGGQHGSHGVQGQVIIDTGSGEPQILDLSELLGIGQGLEGLHGQMLQLHGGPNAQHMIQLEGLHPSQLAPFVGGNIRLNGSQGDEHEVIIDIQDAIRGLDLSSLGADIQAQVEAAIEDAQGDFTFEYTPDLFESDVDYIVESDDPPAPQPSRTVERRATVRGQGQSAQGVTVTPQVMEMRTPQAITTFGQMAEQPRVMLGITMGDAPAETLEALGLDIAAIRVDRVIEGLPAAEAGLKAGSIIVGIEGERGATPARLREVLSGREPGDTVTVVVFERGQKREVEIELEAYDAEALQVQVEGMPTEGNANSTWTFQGLGGGDHDALQIRIREAIDSMSASGVTEIDPEALRQKIEVLVRDHLSQFEGVQGFSGQMRVPGRVVVAPGAHGQPGQQGEMLFLTPQPPSAPGAPAVIERRVGGDVDARLNELSDRMTRLEERLDRLMQLMERGPRD